MSNQNVTRGYKSHGYSRCFFLESCYFMLSWLQGIHLPHVYVVMVTGDTFTSCLCCHGYRGYICLMSVLSWLQGIHLPHVYVVMITRIHLPHVCVVMVTGDTFASCLCCHDYKNTFASCLCCHGYRGYICLMSMLSWLQGIHLPNVYVVMVTGDTFTSYLCCHGYRGYIWVMSWL